MSEISKHREPAAFRVDPAEGPSWLTFRCEEDLRESGLITDGDKVVALIELLALRERAEPVGWTDEQELRDVNERGCGYLFTVKPITPHADPRRVIKLYAEPPAPVGLREWAEPPVLPEGLHPATADLVLRFATALAEKLHKAEEKYGYSDNWQRNDWYHECLQSLWEHIEKGDPRDVAAYCAFMWYHGWKTEPAAPPAPVVPDGLRIALSNAGIAAPESDEVLWASQQDYIQMLVTWVKDRKPFKPVAVPVAESEYVRREVHVGGNTWVQCSAQAYERAKAEGKITRELYERPEPAVAVPDAIEPDYEVIKRILPTSNPDEYACCIAADMWNACRAAMLAVPVVSGWIPCSERMPKIGDEIFYYCEDDGIRDCGIVVSSNFTGRGDSELFVHSEGFDLHFGADITHWMPLPAAPGREG